MWAKGAATGLQRIRSPRLHDFTTGIAVPYTAGPPTDFIGNLPGEPLVPNDPLTVEMTGGAAETDVGAHTIYYTDLDGAAASLATCAEVAAAVRNMVTVQVLISAATTLGDWSPGTPLNTTDDKLHADEKYAVLGYIPTNQVCTIAIAGPDTGNYRVGGPGGGQPLETRDYFWRMSQESGRPYIPIVKANNKGGTQLYQQDNAAGAANAVYLILAELSL
jgi:hypothetical protein